MKNKERKLATIEIIKNIVPIEGADNIEKVQVRDWYCIAKKGEFKIGDKCVYFEIDSLLPMIPAFEFMKSRGTKKTLVNGEEKEGYRLKTIRLRGTLSQGLALPLNNFDIDGEIGDDVTEKLGVYKFEQILPVGMGGDPKGYFPSHTQKTDEERIQNCGGILKKYKNEKFVVTEKIDGTSSTFYIKDGEFGICGRNIEFKLENDNLYTFISKKYDIEEKLRKLGRNLSIQGEIAGPGIQKNILKLSDKQLFVFNIFDIDKGEYVGFEEFSKIIEILELPTVPVYSDNYQLPDTIDELLTIADENSLINPKVKKEGFVFKTYDEKHDMDYGRVSFKVISNNYLLKNN